MMDTHNVILEPQVELEFIKMEDTNPLLVLSDIPEPNEEATDKSHAATQKEKLLACMVCLSTTHLSTLPPSAAWLSTVTPIHASTGICSSCCPALTRATRLVERARQSHRVLDSLGELNTNNLKRLNDFHRPLVKLTVKRQYPDIYDNEYTYDDETKRKKTLIEIKIEKILKYETENLSDEEIDLKNESDSELLDLLNDDNLYNSSDDEPIGKSKMRVDMKNKKKYTQTVKSKTTLKRKIINKTKTKVTSEKKNVKRRKINLKRTKDDPIENNKLLNEYFELKVLTIDEQKAILIKRKMGGEYENAKFKCDDCFKGFEEEKDYEKHMAEHSDKNLKFMCKVCGKQCTTPNGYTKHSRSHLKRRKFSCKRCNFTTTLVASAKVHADMHNGKVYECDKCGQAFGRQPSYLSHMRIKHPSDHVCVLCGYSFLGERGIYCHKKRAHKGEDETIPEDSPSCTECNIRFKNAEALNTHRRVSTRHSDLKLYNNPQRPKTVVGGGGRRGRRPAAATPKDLRLREREETVFCEQCGAPQSCAFAYRRHFERYHSSSTRTVFPDDTSARSLCPICGNSVKNLSLHMTVHSSAKFHCEAEGCGKSFKTKQALFNHSAIHSEPRFVCPTCGKRFNQRSNLNRHYTYVHTTIRDVKCDYCDKYYKSVDEKNAHAKYVHLKKPWPKKRRGKTVRIDGKPNRDYDSDSLIS